MKGYHQCPLDEKSQALTTFITCLKYLRAPYSLSSIAEHYNHHMAEAFEGLSGFRRVVDDVVIYYIKLKSCLSVCPTVTPISQQCQHGLKRDLLIMEAESSRTTKYILNKNT